MAWFTARACLKDVAVQRAVRHGTDLESALFSEDLEALLQPCPTPGLGSSPKPLADGSLPPLWSLQQADTWPVLLASLRMGNLSDSAAAFASGASSAARAALSAHVQASVTALLRGDFATSTDGVDASGQLSEAGSPRCASAQKRIGVPPQNSSMEEQLHWLRPSAFLALLQSMLLLMRVLRWFYSGSACLLEAALVSVQVRRHQLA